MIGEWGSMEDESWLYGLRTDGGVVFRTFRVLDCTRHARTEKLQWIITWWLLAVFDLDEIARNDSQGV